MRIGSTLAFVLILVACGSKQEKIHPHYSAITESVYASGLVKSRLQYQAFATVSGIVDSLFVEDGDTVTAGQPIMHLSGEVQKLSRENAQLAERFADIGTNRDRLAQAQRMLDVARDKMLNDSLLSLRQKNLFNSQVGTRVELEQRELAYENSRAAFFSAQVNYQDLKKQLELNSEQSKRSARIAGRMEDDYTIRSRINGVVYDIMKEVGEIVTPQTPLAVIGEAGHFRLEMQVDEDDIFLVKQGQKLYVTMDSYKGKVFEAAITRVDPLMNERSKTFEVEGAFTKGPPSLLPNVTFEATIVVHQKQKALLIPRACLVNDSTVLDSKGKEKRIQTGLADLKMVEIISGLTESDELQLPKK